MSDELRALVEAAVKLARQGHVITDTRAEFYPDGRAGSGLLVAVSDWLALGQQDRDAALAAPLTVEALATALDDHVFQSDPARCECGDWHSFHDPGSFNDHLAAAILAALPAPPAAPTSDPWAAPGLADRLDAAIDRMDRQGLVVPYTLTSERWGRPLADALRWHAEYETTPPPDMLREAADLLAAPTSESRREAVERLPKDREWHIGYGNDMYLVIVYDPHTGDESRRGAGASLPAAVDAALADRGQEERTDG